MDRVLNLCRIRGGIGSYIRGPFPFFMSSQQKITMNEFFSEGGGRKTGGGGGGGWREDVRSFEEERRRCLSLTLEEKRQKVTT